MTVAVSSTCVTGLRSPGRRMNGRAESRPSTLMTPASGPAEAMGMAGVEDMQFVCRSGAAVVVAGLERLAGGEVALGRW